MSEERRAWCVSAAAALSVLAVAAPGCGRFGLSPLEGDAGADGDADADADVDADADADADAGAPDGDPGQDPVVLVAVRSPVREVTRDEPAATVLVDLRNDGERSVEDVVVTLSFDRAGADRSADYVVTPEEAVVLPPRDERTLDLSVRVLPDALPGAVTVDALLRGTTSDGHVVVVRGADSTLEWSVLDRNTCLDPIELVETPAGSWVFVATVEDICDYASSGDLESCGLPGEGPDVVFSYTPPWDRYPSVSIDAGSLPVRGELRALEGGCPGRVIEPCIDRDGYFSMAAGVVHVIAVQSGSPTGCGPVTVTLAGS